MLSVGDKGAQIDSPKLVLPTLSASSPRKTFRQSSVNAISSRRLSSLVSSAVTNHGDPKKHNLNQITVPLTLPLRLTGPAGASHRSRRTVELSAVSLAWLQSFASSSQSQWSTLDVMNYIVLRRTRKHKQRYADLLPKRYLGHPTFFVSHRWTDNFCNLVDRIVEYCTACRLGKPENIFLWIDIFAVNQHRGQAQADDLRCLEHVIHSTTKGTLLMMDSAGGVLTRVWCLFEIHQTLSKRDQKEADLFVLMPKMIDVALFKNVWSELDVENAEATVPDDRNRILAAIRKVDGDTQQLTHNLKRALVNGANLRANTAHSLFSSLGNRGIRITAAREFYLASLMDQAHLLRLSDCGTDALLLLETISRVRNESPKEKPEQQLKIAECLYEMSDVYATLGRHTEALKACGVSLMIRERFLKSPSHPDRIASRARHVQILIQLDRHSDAEADARALLSMRREQYKTGRHASIVESLHSLATILQQRGQLDEALTLAEEANVITAHLSGPLSTPYAKCLMLEAQILLALNRAKTAHLFAQHALDVRKRVFGVEHSLTSSAQSFLSSIPDECRGVQTFSQMQSSLDGSQSNDERMTVVRMHVVNDKHAFKISSAQLHEPSLSTDELLNEADSMYCTASDKIMRLERLIADHRHRFTQLLSALDHEATFVSVAGAAVEELQRELEQYPRISAAP